MNFLSRKARAAQRAKAEQIPGTVDRVIEITVERDWVSVMARSQSAVHPAPATEASPLPPRRDEPPFLEPE
jgi:hypothetical protein